MSIFIFGICRGGGGLVEFGNPCGDVVVMGDKGGHGGGNVVLINFALILIHV